MSLSRTLRSPAVLLALAALGLLLAVGALYVSLKTSPKQEPALAAVSTPTQPPADTPTTTPEPTATPSPEIPIARLEIPAIDVDAPVVTKGVNADGAMQDPDGPREVAWYNFSVLPGRPGNIVMAGHLDYINVGAAVFYHLRDLKQGDEVTLALANGESAVYRVTDVTSYDDATAPVQEIVGPTPLETVTLITCGGSFNRQTREYDKRVVVRAVRV